jgi:hypothetical protein
MTIAILAGVAVGLIGFIPYAVAGDRLRKNPASATAVQAVTLIAGFVASFAILAVGAVLCIAFFRDLALPFAIAEVAALLVAAAAFGAKKLVRK